MKQKLISVIGGHECTKETAELAEKIGQIIAEEKCIVVCGGRKGIMQAVCKGAKKVGGSTIGILPSIDGEDANEFVDIHIRTGLGYARNSIVANTSDIVIALKGECGTLSEIGFALTYKRQVLSFGQWNVKGVIELTDPEQIRDYIRKIK
ncbi:MAG: TIGR00725 family protein [Candidatus Omnitrophica bacterium]|nr:TIGR00725 family protein [Candidatus Omnitrophota bacterium]